MLATKLVFKYVVKKYNYNNPLGVYYRFLKIKT